MWQIYPCRTAISQILIPILTAHIWPTRCDRSTPVEQQFHRFWFLFWQHIFGRPGVADLPPPHRMAISQVLIPILTAHIWQTRCGRSTPTPLEWQFHRFWFLFWHLIFGRSGVADLPSPHRMAISQILIPILTAHIWQTRCGRSNPCRTAISQILIPILTAHIWQTRCGRSTPVEQQFHRFWFLFWQLIFGRQGVADLTPPHRMAISQILIPILTAYIWQTRCGRSTPVEQQFHRFWFLFWQLIFGKPGVADLPPVEQQFHIFWFLLLTAHIWQTRCGRSTPTP